MKYVVLLVWVVLYLQSGVSSGYEIFDYFKLSMVWIPSVCNVKRCAVVPISQKFSMHGLWPVNYASSEREIFPAYCDDMEYVPITDQDLYVQMNIYWPNLKDGRLLNHKIWKYAWDKHGTCSLIWYSELEYFNLAIILFHNFDVLAHLIEKGVVPANDHTYSAERIRLGIIELTTKEPDLYCQMNKNGQWQLLEIRICYTPGGQIEDCDAAALKRTCYKQVYFPALPNPPGP